MPDAGFLTAALAGLTGSLHCVAMCGGYVAAAQPPGGARPLRPARELRAGLALAQLGRLTTYGALGAALGAAGGPAFMVGSATTQRVLYVIANVVLLGVAARMARPAVGAMALERAGLALFQRVAPLARPLLHGDGWAQRYVLGVLWGLTPCALIHGLVPVALLSGSALAGASVMLGLWLGTLPALALAGGLVQRLSTPHARRIAALMVGAFALVGVYRALVLPGVAGPFCELW